MTTTPNSSNAPAPRPRRGKLVRRILLVIGITLVALIARPVWFLWNVAQHDIADRPAAPVGTIDDASALNATAVAEVWSIPEDRDEAERQLAEVLTRAQRDRLKVSIAGARHTMGGHTIAPDGIVIDMRPFRSLSLDTNTNILTAGAGAIWHDIIGYLDPQGRSVQIMQSNDSFTVGGSISVNCHGWQYGHPPIASTVESFRFMKANGTIVTCSRTENTELFSLVLGGYGLFGIILDAQLRVTNNVRYRVVRHVVPATEAMQTYRDKVEAAGKAAMVYARLDVSRDNFLKEAMIYVLEEELPSDEILESVGPPGFVSLRRSIFRGSTESDYGKRLRWDAETHLQPALAPSYYTRNQVLDEGVEVFQNRSADTTDILHEYFLPPDRLEEFIISLRDVIPRSRANLLNVTIRSINEDHDTVLRYADQPILSAVMLFSQPRTAAGDAAMQLLTRELIDHALRLGGRYYLPYRLHATREQFHRAYPQAQAFFDKKREYDPHELFINRFYLTYGMPDVVTEEN